MSGRYWNGHCWKDTVATMSKLEPVATVTPREPLPTEELHTLYGEPARAETDADRDAVRARFAAPVVTRREDGAYTVGPPPDGRSVAEHLDELSKPAIAHPFGLNAIEPGEMRRRFGRDVEADRTMPFPDDDEAALDPPSRDLPPAETFDYHQHGFTRRELREDAKVFATGAQLVETARAAEVIKGDELQGTLDAMKTFREESADMPRIDRAANDHSKCTKEPCSPECDGPAARRKATDRGGSAFRKG